MYVHNICIELLNWVSFLLNDEHLKLNNLNKNKLLKISFLLIPKCSVVILQTIQQFNLIGLRKKNHLVLHNIYKMFLAYYKLIKTIEYNNKL